ncbi:unnamed protein product [Cylicocyclus nassatus]|uniref:Uncharacterized protein n=1 Tax=Cylicocyclus nassatus TaxID=53992 RepID=A0AA36GYB1_CYLNA|nr:unnamed protein product [Cylicocyclus nassatus]
MTSFSPLRLCEHDSEHIMDHYTEVEDRIDADGIMEDEALEQKVAKLCADADITGEEDGSQLPEEKLLIETYQFSFNIRTQHNLLFSCKSFSSTGTLSSNVINDIKAGESFEKCGPTLFQQVLIQNEELACGANDSTESSSASNSKSSVENAMDGDMQSIVVTPASSILYPTAVTVSFSSFNSGDSQSEELLSSLYTASDGRWSQTSDSRSDSLLSFSTGVGLSDSDSEACNLAINSCSSSTSMNTAVDSRAISVAEDESEAISIAGESNMSYVHSSEESLWTAKSLSCTLLSKQSSKTARPPLLEVDDLHTAVEAPFVLHTAWERTADTHTLPFMTENCLASEEHSDSFASAQSSSGCGPLYCSFIEEQEELHEIKSLPNLGSSRG